MKSNNNKKEVDTEFELYKIYYSTYTEETVYVQAVSTMVESKKAIVIFTYLSGHEPSNKYFSLTMEQFISRFNKKLPNFVVNKK